MKAYVRLFSSSIAILAAAAALAVAPVASPLAQAGGGGGGGAGATGGPPIPWEMLKGMGMEQIMGMMKELMGKMKGGGGGSGGGGGGNSISSAERASYEQQLAALQAQLSNLQNASKTTVVATNSTPAASSANNGLIDYNKVGTVATTTTAAAPTVVTSRNADGFAKSLGADNTAGTLYVAPVRSNGSLAGEGFRFGSFFSGSNSNGTIYIGANGGLRGGEGAYVAEGNGTPIRIGATESAYAQQIVTMASNGTRIGAEGFNGGQVVVLTPAQIMAAKERFRKGHTDGRQNLPPASSDADYMEGYRSGLNGQALTV